MGQKKGEQRKTQSVEKLVFFHNGQWVTTTVAIAQGMEAEHAAVLQFIREHLADLEKFGHVTFESLPDELQVNPSAYALLNRHQAVALLLAYPVEPQIARTFSARLLKVFLEMNEPHGTEQVSGKLCAHSMLAAVEQVLSRFFPNRAELLLVMTWIMNTMADRLDNQSTSQDGELSAVQSAPKPRRIH
jgi:phage regulator Rha-like protein